MMERKKKMEFSYLEQFLKCAFLFVKNHPSEMGGMISSASLSGGF